jgi:hypothetical protein
VAFWARQAHAFTFEFEFEALSVDDGSIGWEIIDNQGQVVAQWAGELGDATPDLERRTHGQALTS